jgi:hypothetical protein
MANWREELLFEKGPFDKPDSVLKREARASANKDAREAKAKDKAKSAKKYRRYQQDTLDYKRERLRWQQERSLKKDKERRKREQEAGITGPLKDIKTQTISGKDPDSTAGAKLVGNVASLAGGVAKAGVAALAQNMKKRQKAKRKAQIEAGTQKAQEKSAEIKTSMTQPKLPPARTLGQRARANKSIRQTEISNRMPKKPYNFKQSKFDKPTNEEYSCWREEFLCELGDIRRKKKPDKNDRTVNVMTGKNKITLFPTIVESHDDDMEMFRQHSKENAPESGGHTPGRARTSNLLAKMRELGMQTDPKKKKKNKKKRVIDEAGPVLSVGRGEKLPVSQGAGLTAKGRAKYNRETGSNLKAPVTGDVKPGSKAAQRRKNFCSRSRSWKGERGLAARRRWKC